MRIISGKFKGRRFTPPAKNWPTRPTTDYSKEGLYNILQNTIDFDNVTFLDLFGGTGNHCYEFISRGCKEATYVDRHGPCVAFAKSMREKLEIESELTVVKMDVFKFIKKSNYSYDIIFAGPPYPLNNIPEIPTLIFEANMLKPNGILIVEHNPNVEMSGHPNFTQIRNYSKTLFSFFENTKSV